MNEIINEIRQEVGALLETSGINRAVLIVDIAQKLSLLSQRAGDMQRELDTLKAPLNEPDGETIAGKHYTYGEVAK
jgi:hypothetical protein